MRQGDDHTERVQIRRHRADLPADETLQSRVPVLAELSQLLQRDHPLQRLQLKPLRAVGDEDPFVDLEGAPEAVMRMGVTVPPQGRALTARMPITGSTQQPLVGFLTKGFQ
jgi:hypothetical protein